MAHILAVIPAISCSQVQNDLVVAQMENLPPHINEATCFLSLCHDRFIRQNIFTSYM